MKKQSGHIVIEMTTEGINVDTLKAEPRTPVQEQVLKQLDPKIQRRILDGYPITVIDSESEREIAAFNMSNIKPSKYAIEALARTLSQSISEFYKDPENVAKYEKWKKEHHE